jgi:hypothetical protein
MADVHNRTGAETPNLRFKRLTMSSKSSLAGLAPRFSFRTPSNPLAARAESSATPNIQTHTAHPEIPACAALEVGA